MREYRLKAALVAVLILCLCVPTGSAVGSDAHVQDAVVMTINGEAIRQSALDAAVRNFVIMNTYSEEGFSEVEKQARTQQACEMALRQLIRETVCLQEAARRNITAEMTAEDAQARYDGMIEAVESYVRSAYPGLEGAALDAQVDALLSAIGDSRAGYYAIAKKSALLAALDAQLAQEAPAPTEEEINARYAELLKEQQVSFDADENAYEAALLAGEAIVYRPRDIKQLCKVEVLFEEGAYALILATEKNDAVVADEMRADQYEKAEMLADQIRREILGGGAPETVLADHGMELKLNYYNAASTRFAEDYASRARALEQAGDVSTVWRMPNGCAFLVYCGEIPASGVVPLEAVRKSIEAALRAEGLQAWVDGAKAELVRAAQIEVEGNEP